MYYNDDATKKQFEPVSDVAKSYSWAFEKAESVKNNFKYIYLKDDAVAEKEADMLTIQAYYLVDGDNGFKHDTDNNKYALAKHKDKKSENLSRLVFKKNVDGTYSVICLDSELNAEKAADNYDQVVTAGAQRLYVDVNEASFKEGLVGEEQSYTNVTVDFYQLGISLEATPRHATLDGDEGSIRQTARLRSLLSISLRASLPKNLLLKRKNLPQLPETSCITLRTLCISGMKARLNLT